MTPPWEKSRTKEAEFDWSKQYRWNLGLQKQLSVSPDNSFDFAPNAVQIATTTERSLLREVGQKEESWLVKKRGRRVCWVWEGPKETTMRDKKKIQAGQLRYTQLCQTPFPK